MLARNPLSTLAFSNWLSKQPADQEYDYTDPSGCLVAQYLHAIGYPQAIVSSHEWYDGPSEPYPSDWRNIARSFPRTFGAAYELSLKYL